MYSERSECPPVNELTSNGWKLQPLKRSMNAATPTSVVCPILPTHLRLVAKLAANPRPSKPTTIQEGRQANDASSKVMTGGRSVLKTSSDRAMADSRRRQPRTSHRIMPVRHFSSHHPTVDRRRSWCAGHLIR